jgi:hypothetical protein
VLLNIVLLLQEYELEAERVGFVETLLISGNDGWVDSAEAEERRASVRNLVKAKTALDRVVVVKMREAFFALGVVVSGWLKGNGSGCYIVLSYYYKESVGK